MLDAFGSGQRLSLLVAGLWFMPLGLAIGSFCTVILHRVPLRRSIVWPGSHCPSCGHHLGALDLVPVLSFLWLRGRCRYCTLRIHRTYVLVEVGSGLATAVASLVGGPGAGWAMLAGLVIASTAVALMRRGRHLADQSGFTLVEVLVAVLLLTLTAAAVFQTISVGRQSAVAAQRRTHAVGLARQYFAEASVEAMNSPTGPSDRSVPIGDYFVSVNTRHHNTPNAWWVTVAVSCPNCKGVQPLSGGEASLTGVVRR